METLNIGRRIELISMDAHCGDISLGLYHRDTEGGPQVLVHTYAASPEATARLAFIERALQVMVGMVPATEPHWLRFSCGKLHERPLRRAFVEVCKLPSDSQLEAKGLQLFDKKAGCDLTAVGVGDGRYRITASETLAAAEKRVEAFAAGLVKVGGMALTDSKADVVAFDCNTPHDEMLSLLLVRAQNVRAAMREENESLTRGVLAAPSQQK